jgi:ferredoxin
MSCAVVIDSKRRRHVLEAVEGWRQMEIIRGWGIPIGCECGGAGAYGMCHLEVAAPWHDRLPPRADDEEAKLDELPLVAPNTRRVPSRSALTAFLALGRVFDQKSRHNLDALLRLAMKHRDHIHANCAKRAQDPGGDGSGPRRRVRERQVRLRAASSP